MAEIIHDVCIVGAGAGGLQLGHFLFHEKRSKLQDYVIFERSGVAGSFFTRFPIHRMLISLNKRHTRSSSAEFRMRHDWNSLLGSRQAGARPMTERTKEFYPHADILAKYLSDFAYEQASRIEYLTEVLSVSQPSSGYFNLRLRHLADGNRESKRQCRRVVVASGLATPHVPKESIVGAELLLGYEQLAPTGGNFENQSVLVWGFGNAAHETARELQKHTQAIHLLHRRGAYSPGSPFAVQAERSAGLPRLALFTHYPGDIRTVTMQIYDSYLLKALDVKLPYGEEEEPVFLRCLEQQLCVWVSRSSRCGGGGETRHILPSLVASADGPRRCAVEVGAFDPAHSVARPLLAILSDLTASGIAKEGRDFAWADAADGRNSSSLAASVSELGFRSVEEYLSEREREKGIINNVFELRGRRLEMDSMFLASAPGRPLLDVVARLRPRLAQDPLRHPFHAGVRCLGWRMDLTLFDPALQKQLVDGERSSPSKFSSASGLQATYPKGKYPPLDSGYQAIGVPGLYFAGALAHSRDYRRSAGGFIHGFRYTARALHRILQREDGLGWPNVSFALDSPRACERLMQRLWRRVGEAAGPYQMFGELADAVLFRRGDAGLLIAEYLEEVPIAYLNEEWAQLPRMIIRFVYGRRFGPMDLPSPGAVGYEFAEFSAFLHPRLELLAGAGSDEGAGLPKLLSHIGGGQSGVVSRPLMAHCLVEDVFTEWQAHVGHIDPLVRFLSAAISHVATLLGVSHLVNAETLAAIAGAASAAWKLSDGSVPMASANTG